MKILIISDSHGNKRGIDKIFKEYTFDYLFYLGDGLNDLGTFIELDNVYAVSGNCDFFSEIANERIFNLQGYKFMLTHGNKYGVKRTLDYLHESALDEKVNFVFFGHTHSNYMDKYKEIYFANPGSFQIKENNMAYGLALDIQDNRVDFSVFSVDCK